MRGLFITGTDTDVGKTFFTAGLARLWRSQGIDVRVCKPVASGGEETESGIVCEDTRQLGEAAGDADLEAITPWAFVEPVAPPVAARRHGVNLTVGGLAEAVRRRWVENSVLLVEGVGGLLCPLTEAETVADLVAELSSPMVVVARRSLGTLNHTLLTLEVARNRGLDVVGLVMTETTPVEGLAERTNADEVRSRIDVPLLAVIGHQRDRVTGWEEATLGGVDWLGLVTF